MKLPSRPRLAVGSVATLLLVLICSNGCATRGAKLDKDSQPARRIAYAQASAPFAAMSALAYDTSKETEAEKKRYQKLGDYLKANGWEKSANYEPTEVARKLSLHYDVWVNANYRPKIVVIAVRGTEFTKLEDWKSNLWWLTRFLFPEANQYSRAPSSLEAGRPFKDYAGRDDTTFITTGHSLGGGVAQCLRYAFPLQVTQCYAFNSSPVTAFKDDHGRSEVDGKKLRDDFNQMLPIAAFPSHRTLRIYEKGEVLAYVRAQMRLFNPIDEKIIEVRWNFDEITQPITNHGMLTFAEKIVEVATDPKNELAPGYEPWWRKPGPPPPGAVPAASKAE